ncbi:uncharacterized protein RSE6_04877 [Rhynchosporium secalis]|uniref:Uncharacterized protein n=1 Tax=Rhynchosporium secalis TaxID=38038 RepID=A0A1E1M6E2_RHYSE|nr:uncharacterized protein RSE6_04877 [Rhynchosporium secalis]
MPGERSRFRNFFHLVSPGLPSSAAREDRQPSSRLIQAQNSPDDGGDVARLLQSEPSITTLDLSEAVLQQAPPSQQALYNQEQRYDHTTYPHPPPLAHRSPNPSRIYQTYLSAGTEHICRFCANTDRFLVRPTHCPFTGDVTFPQPQQHDFMVSHSSTFRLGMNKGRRVHFEDIEAESREYELVTRQSGQGTGEWGDGTTVASYEYLSKRRRNMFEDWMDECIGGRCPGWEIERGLDT